jgi:hypothetical protein
MIRCTDGQVHDAMDLALVPLFELMLRCKTVRCSGRCIMNGYGN